MQRFRLFALVVGLALVALASVSFAQPATYRLVIKQRDGTILGTLEIPAGVAFRIATRFEGTVPTAIAYRVDLGKPSMAPPVVVSAIDGATIQPER